MTPTEKLIKKEFKIASEDELFNKIKNNQDDFFKENFFTDKESYLERIKKLVGDINAIGNSYSEYMQMVKSGSMMYGAYTSIGFGEIQKDYRDKRKQLKNHVRFFV